MDNQKNNSPSTPIVTATAVPIGEQINNHEISNQFRELYSLSRTVKFLACIDIFFAFLNTFINPFYIIGIIMGFFGYYGAKKYNKCNTLTYLIFNIFDFIGELGLIFYVSYSNIQVSTFWYVVSIIGLIVDLWIIKIICKFYNKLKILNDEEVERLSNVRRVVVYTPVYW